MNTSRYVMDSYAILALMHKEPGHERVRRMIEDAQAETIGLHMSLINMAEVQYRIMRQGRNVQDRLAAVQSLPLIMASADAYIDAVVNLKARHAVSLADCFAAALALDLGWPVVTGDPEFRKLEGVVEVEWLGGT